MTGTSPETSTHVELRIGDEGFEEHPVWVRTAEFFSAWRRRDYGALAAIESPEDIPHGSTGNRIEAMEKAFEGWPLQTYSISSLTQAGPARCTVEGTAVVNGLDGDVECDWRLVDGEWKLVRCHPHVWNPGE